MKKIIKVMLVEDHPEYRETLAFVLGKEKGMELVSQFGNAELALRSLRDAPRDRQPDVVLLDLNLPGISGLEALPGFSEDAPQANVIILSQSDREADILRAVQQGASGYLLKSVTMNEITQGIRTVHNGGATLESGLAQFILQTLQPKLPKAPDEMPISPRELEVLALIAEGLPQKQIGDALQISAYTVTDHLKQIYKRLNVVNAPQAISEAYKTGILPTDK